jgi:hypothetical protein
MSELEKSKERLANAFKALESLIQSKIVNNNNQQDLPFDASSEIEILRKSNQSLRELNSELSEKLFLLENKCQHLKSTNQEVLEHIDEIIANLKKIS